LEEEVEGYARVALLHLGHARLAGGQRGGQRRLDIAG
jgi:hypothetical protein